jgi:hypothetical protein
MEWQVRLAQRVGECPGPPRIPVEALGLSQAFDRWSLLTAQKQGFVMWVSPEGVLDKTRVSDVGLPGAEGRCGFKTA